jgi:hypothetical protein
VPGARSHHVLELYWMTNVASIMSFDWQRRYSQLTFDLSMCLMQSGLRRPLTDDN